MIRLSWFSDHPTPRCRFHGLRSIMLDFNLISTLSHFFKGSSAALGVLKVSTTCGEIHLCSSLEHLKTSSQRASGKGCLQLGILLKNVAVEYLEASDWLKGHYQRKDDIASMAKDNLRDLVSLGKSGLSARRPWSYPSIDGHPPRHRHRP